MFLLIITNEVGPVVINKNHIVEIKQFGNRVEIYLVNNQIYTAEKTIKDFFEALQIDGRLIE